MATEATREGEKQGIRLSVDSSVKGQLEFREGTSVDIGAYLGFGMAVEAVDDLPRRMNGGSNDIVPLL